MSEPISTPAPAPVEPTAPAASAPEKPGIAAVISAIVTSARGKLTATAELASAKQAIATLTTERDTARAEVTAAKSEISNRDTSLAAKDSQLAAFAGFFGLPVAELAGKDAAACTALLKARIDTAALEAIAAMGVPPADLPKASAVPDAPKKDPTLTGRDRYAADFARQLAAAAERN